MTDTCQHEPVHPVGMNYSNAYCIKCGYFPLPLEGARPVTDEELCRFYQQPATDAPPPQQPDDAEFEEWKDSEGDDLVTEMYRAQREADGLRAELAALRTRLETAEGALRAVLPYAEHYVALASPRPRAGKQAIEGAKLALKPEPATIVTTPHPSNDMIPDGPGLVFVAQTPAPAPGGSGETVRHCPVSISECYYDCPLGTCRLVERESARGEEEGWTP